MPTDDVKLCIVGPLSYDGFATTLRIKEQPVLYVVARRS